MAAAILKDSTVLCGVTASESNWRYPAEQQLADFGSLPDIVTWLVAQLSRLYGPGTPNEITSHL
jgi:hypothetical protein